MKTVIEKLKQEILQKIASFANSGAVDEITIWSAKASRVQEIERVYEGLKSQLARLEEEVRDQTSATPQLPPPRVLEPLDARLSMARNGSRRTSSSIRIDIDWGANGKSHPNEIITGPKASDCLARLMKRLLEVYGQRALDVASQMRINRGPFVSRNPTLDFRNSANGRLYSHQRIQETGYFVLTHSQTSQKVDDVKRLFRQLGLVPGSYRVTQINQRQMMNDMLRNLTD